MTFQKITRIMTTLLFGICAFLAINSVKIGGGRVYAQICLAAALILCVIVFVMSLKTSKIHQAEEAEEAKIHEPILFKLNVFILWICPLLAYFVWKYTNAFYAVTIMGFLMLYVMRKRPIQSAVIAVCCGLAFVFMFHNLMGLPLSTPSWWPDTSFIF